MSKVLVDRELLEKWADKLEGADSAGYGWEDLLAAEVRGAIAQPAEAEGVSVERWLHEQGEYHLHPDGEWVLYDDHLAALSAVPGLREYITKGLAEGTLSIGGAISATGERTE
ncbi:hypothetical protein NAV33_07515 [Pseudomonas stutzeri]|uniref:hypothetical protein n=1 Tax=Stutzerimonas stutzeri TaxID=316 RepID=UPI00210E448F|nr:hypothetical protein [Stutzerimonas stutzeri]MCQ4311743.1 hypothetical protein [Stutzerimonas stutzeri]